MPSRGTLGLAAAAAAAGAIAAYLHYRSKSRSKGEGSGLRVLRSAYTPPQYKIEHVDLNFVLTEEEAVTESTLSVSCSGQPGAPLHLDGEELTLRSISMDGAPLCEGTDYLLEAEGLTVLSPPSTAFKLKIIVATKPQDNTQLSGLYKTSGNYCTQCEAVGLCDC
jgi:aminopeptidase N